MSASVGFKQPGCNREARGSFSMGGVLLPAMALLLLTGSVGAQDAGKRGVLGRTPAKVEGRWPNDARDTFWYSDYETANRVARASGRPILLVVNRGAPCEV